MTTSSPPCASRPAHTSPAGPAPMTTTSKLRSVMAQQSTRRRPALQARCPWHPPAMLRSAVALLVVVAALVACGSGPAEPDATAASAGVRLVKVGRFNAPLYVTAPPGDRRRIFVVEQGGRIMEVRGGRQLSTPFLDIRSKVLSGGEQGLLSMAFAPDYAQSGLFYVYYTERPGTESISEYPRASDDRADPNSARLVLRMGDAEPNHNGGLMIFGADNLMYVRTGDGGGGNDQHGARGNAQSLDSLLGKILRIDPRAANGRPVYGDYCNSHLRVATLRDGHPVASRTLSGVPTISGVSSFGEDTAGRV